MQLKIRLRRTGATKQPSYRVVVAKSTSPRDGAFIEILGHYNPLTTPPTININTEKAKYWLEHGAQPTDATVKLLRKAGMDIEPPRQKGQTAPKAAKEEAPQEGEAAE